MPTQGGCLRLHFRRAKERSSSPAANWATYREVVSRWEQWADVQTRVDIGGRPVVDPVEVRTILDRIRAEVGR